MNGLDKLSVSAEPWFSLLNIDRDPVEMSDKQTQGTRQVLIIEQRISRSESACESLHGLNLQGSFPPFELRGGAETEVF